MTGTKDHKAEKPGTMDELHKLVTEFDTAMLTTVGADGALRARPMALQDPAKRPGGDLWMITSSSSGKADEIHRDPRVLVSCYRARDRAWLSVAARATLVHDAAKIRELWQPSWKAWFPDGPDDPSIALLELTVERAEYWEPEGGRLKVMFEMAKAMLKGEPAAAHIEPPHRLER